MKNCKWLVVCLALTIALLSASASYGQSVLVGAGSSALFPTVGLSATSPDPITGAAALCGANFWTGGSGSASSIATAVDSRGGGIHPEPGNLWVAWDNDTTPTKVCAFISVDSIVGQRLFLEQGAPGTGNGTLSLGPSADYTVGANKVAFAQDNTSCATSVGSLSFSVDLSSVGTTTTAVVHGGGNFSNYFANGAIVTVAGSTNANYNLAGKAIGGVTQLGPLSWTYTTAGGAADATGGATATVVANCPGLPSAVHALLTANPHFTVAFTDIRPEDGNFAYHRANDLGSFPGDPTTANMDYAGKGILSSYSTAVAFPVNYNITGTDPISGQPIPGFVTQGIGADPIIIVASRNNVTACGLGNGAFTSVSSSALGRAYAGLAGATQDVSPALVSSASGCPAPVWPVEREPLSGTYNTFEWQVIRDANNRDRSQENGNISYPQSNNNGAACGAWVAALTSTAASSFPPAVAPPQHFDANNCGNPLNIQVANYSTLSTAAGVYGGFGGNRTRAVGTGEMVGVINAGAGTKDSIGYAFYSLGTFGGKSGLKYVMLDNADPLYPSYTGNVVPGQVAPVCTGFVNKGSFSCPTPQPSFDGVIGGGYRAWSVLRAVYTGTTLSTCSSPFTTLSIGCLIQASQDQAAAAVKDFVPVTYCANASCSSQIDGMPFFRSHYQNSGVTPHDGNNPATGACHNAVPIEAGGDMAGAIFADQADFTLQNNIGCTSELTNHFQ
jgi:hypothetical protein